MDKSFTQETYPLIYSWIFNHYAGLFNFIPFSVGDMLYLILMIALIISLYKIIKHSIKGKFFKALKILNKIALGFAFFWLAFHWLWGFNYYKNSLIEDSSTTMKIENLKAMANVHLQRAKNLSKQPLNFKDNSEVKISFFSPVMRYFGVTGYYNPFTAEAQRIGGIPQVRIPFTNSHELAHQKSWAREYEANYMGYKDAIQKNITEQYSAEFIALNYILGAIYQEDSVFVHQKIKQYSPRMKADRAEILKHHERYKGWADQVFSELNHYFLKSNNQKEGIKSYNRFVELLYQDYMKSNK